VHVHGLLESVIIFNFKGCGRYSNHSGSHAVFLRSNPDSGV